MSCVTRDNFFARTLKALLLASLTLLLVGPSCRGDQQELLVFSAASLTDVMQEIGDRFTKSQGIPVAFNFGGSTSIGQQIIRGAPADVFLSAGAGPMDRLEDRGLLRSESRVNLLTNRLVLVASPDRAEKLGIKSLDDLARADARVAIADPELAPAGNYAKEALQDLGLWEKVEQRLVYSPDVRATLAYLDTGNVDAGIVYQTDTRIDQGVEVVALVPVDSHTFIVYPVAVIGRSGQSQAAGKFLEHLRSEETRLVFLEHGFSPLQ